MNQSRLVLLFFSLTIGLVLVTSCTQDGGKTPTALESPLQTPVTSLDSPLVSPNPTETTTGASLFKVSTPLPITPATGKGAVTGVIVRDIRGAPIRPLANNRVFLARILSSDGEPVGLASFNEETSPMSLTNAGGQFIFNGIESGMYALIIKTPIQAVLAHDIVQDIDIVATVEIDKVSELGEIHVSLEF